MRVLAVVLLLALSAFRLQAADVSGSWAVTVMLDAGSGTASFVFEQKGDSLSGTYSGVLGQAKVAGTVKGDQVEWSFDGGPAGKVSFHGTLDGANKMKGSAEYGQLGKGSFTGEKK
ncbi:MAG TPA: hypothetical protein VKT49_23225 [Bryobacteraceae bacterium]|nr:hypothetical protein [Bryobacteraceae bacterium]